MPAPARAPSSSELDTYRWREHCGPNFDDELNYRSAEEIAAGKQRCPVTRTQSKLMDTHALSRAQFDTMEREIVSEIDAAFRFAFESPVPSPAAAATKVYA